MKRRGKPDLYELRPAAWRLRKRRNARRWFRLRALSISYARTHGQTPARTVQRLQRLRRLARVRGSFQTGNRRG